MERNKYKKKKKKKKVRQVRHKNTPKRENSFKYLTSISFLTSSLWVPRLRKRRHILETVFPTVLKSEGVWAPQREAGMTGSLLALRPGGQRTVGLWLHMPFKVGLLSETKTADLSLKSARAFATSVRHPFPCLWNITKLNGSLWSWSLPLFGVHPLIQALFSRRTWNTGHPRSSHNWRELPSTSVPELFLFKSANTSTSIRD